MYNSQNNKPEKPTTQQNSQPYPPSQPSIPRPQPPQQSAPVRPATRYPQQQSYQPITPSTPTRDPEPPIFRRAENFVRSLDRRILWIGGGLTALAVFSCMAMVGLLLLVYVAQPRVAQGVRVASLDIGGETLEDAQKAIASNYASQIVNLTDAERTWQVPLSELGISVDSAATIAAAEDAPANSTVQPVYTIDFSQAQAKLISLSTEINIPAENGNPPKNGKALDIPYLLDRLRIDLAGEISDGVLDLPMIETQGEADTSAAYTGVPVTHVVEAGQELGLIAKMYDVSMQDIINLNNIENPDLLFVGQELIIPASGVYTPSQEDAPPAPTPTGKSIVVSTENQRIYAYQDGKLVRTHLVSTGTSRTPTVLGDYKIQYKFAADDMQGPDYFLPQVPWTMYFYQGYAIHGTYWHNAFGRPMSHGCVNLPVDEAKWFYDFADVGTTVRVI